MLCIQIRIILLVLMASLRMVHNDVNDRSILLHCLSPFIRVKLRHGRGKVLGIESNCNKTKTRNQ